MPERKYNNQTWKNIHAGDLTHDKTDKVRRGAHACGINTAYASGCSGKPDAVPTPTAAVQETPTPTPEPTPEPTAAPAPTPEPTATPNPNIPVITVVDATEPSDMKAGNVVDIRGVVKTDKGQLTNVTGRLLKDGEVVQEYAYVPYSPPAHSNTS